MLTNNVPLGVQMFDVRRGAIVLSILVNLNSIYLVKELNCWHFREKGTLIFMDSAWLYKQHYTKHTPTS